MRCRRSEILAHKTAKHESDLAWKSPDADAITCHAVSPFDAPLIVDWKPSQQASLAEAMGHGVPVFAHSCGKLRLLEGCHLEGDFGFLATLRQAETLRFDDADEAAANLPGFGPSLVRRLGGLAPDRVLDLGLLTVGKRTTTVASAPESRLIGGAACVGATHFLHEASVGAFALGTGDRGGPPSNPFATARDPAARDGDPAARVRGGDPAACEASRLDDEAPPEGCRSLLRLSLVGLTTRPQMDDFFVARLTCPAGLERVGGKCARVAASAPHQCQPQDEADCRLQCRRGHAGSCVSLGDRFSYSSGEERPGEVISWLAWQLSLRDPLCEGQFPEGCPALAAAILQHECRRGEPEACLEIVQRGQEDDARPEDRARAPEASRQGLLFARRQCDEGKAAGCIALAHLLWAEPDAPRRGSDPAALLLRTCELGSSQACEDLGLFLSSSPEGGKPRAVALLPRACAGGSVSGCTELGALYLRGEGVPQDTDRAASFTQRACELGSKRSCLDVGEWLSDGTMKPDPARSAEILRLGCRLGDRGSCEAQSASFYQQACEAGDQHACARLGLFYEYSNRGPRDPRQAVRVYQVACDHGETEGCWRLGDLHGRSPSDSARWNHALHDSRQDPVADPGRAFALLLRACEGGMSGACESLGDRFRRGDGVPENKARALAFYQRVCDSGNSSVCVTVGKMYARGEGTPQDRERAFSIFQRECNHRDAEACGELGSFFQRGEIVPQSTRRAYSLFLLACRGHARDACFPLGLMYEQGDPVERNLAVAEWLYAEACSSTNEASCDARMRLLTGH
jgi:hypothetical protein